LRLDSVHYDEAYVLGATLGIPALEKRYRATVVWMFKSFLNHRPELFNRLVNHAPSKIYDLVKEGLETVEKDAERRMRRKSKL
jgi:hypothetical protein